MLSTSSYFIMPIFRDIFLIILLVVGLVPQVAASWKSYPSSYYLASNHQAAITQQEATTIAQRQINGRILAINRIDNAYRIKILSNQGSVHIIIINASNGKIMSSR